MIIFDFELERGGPLRGAILEDRDGVLTVGVVTKRGRVVRAVPAPPDVLNVPPSALRVLLGYRTGV
jgi:hypothetical protein